MSAVLLTTIQSKAEHVLMCATSLLRTCSMQSISDIRTPSMHHAMSKQIVSMWCCSNQERKHVYLACRDTGLVQHEDTQRRAATMNGRCKLIIAFTAKSLS